MDGQCNGQGILAYDSIKRQYTSNKTPLASMGLFNKVVSCPIFMHKHASHILILYFEVTVAMDFPNNGVKLLFLRLLTK